MTTTTTICPSSLDLAAFPPTMSWPDLNADLDAGEASDLDAKTSVYPPIHDVLDDPWKPIQALTNPTIDPFQLFGGPGRRCSDGSQPMESPSQCLWRRDMDNVSTTSTSTNIAEPDTIMQYRDNTRAKSPGPNATKTHSPDKTKQGRRLGRPRNGRRRRTHQATSAELRESNRIAAEEYRCRRQFDNQKLESRKEELESEFWRLSNTSKKLSDELFFLEQMLFAHSFCDCKLIQEYLERSAMDFPLRHERKRLRTMKKKTRQVNTAL